MNSETRNCQNCKQHFTIEPDDFSFYEKMKVPAPVVCPDCRFKMRAVWRNEMSLYNRKCVVTDQNIISVYSPNSLYKVVSLDYYKSEEWDPFDFAQEYDFSKSFFEQFDLLLKNVYKKALFPILSVGANIESDYVNFAGGCKNSYFCFNTAYVENVMYTKGVTNARDTNDSYYSDHLENCYECVNVYNSTNVMWAKNSTACLDCVLIDNCRNCSNCFGCVNLYNQSYYFFNEKLTKEEYKIKISEYLGDYAKMLDAKKQFLIHSQKYPKKLNQNLNNMNCSGDYIFNSKNCKQCFEVGTSEDSKYIFGARNTKDSYGSIGGINASESLENMTPNHCHHMVGTVACENSKNIEYSFCLNNCSDCIGCDSLKNAQYCILNKQYTKEEYEKIRAHIIAELKEKNLCGLIIPSALSPFAYNETIGQDNMPMTKEEAVSSSFRWEENIQITKGKETLLPDQIPNHIADVTDSIKNEILKCIECERNYKITEQELLLYRRMVLPIPRQCFYCRHKDRLVRRGPYKFYDRNCSFCNDPIETTYAPDRPEKVYCEKCYQKEVL